MSTFIFDLDGTLYRDDAPLAGARETVAALRRRGHHVLYASNNSTRTRADYMTKLAALGLEVEPHGLATSAHSTALYLLSLPTPPRSLLILGAPAIAEEIAAAGLEIRTDGAPPVDTVVVGLDRAFTYARLAAAQAAVLAGAALVASNRDPQYPGHDRLYPGAGSIVAAVESATQATAHTVGKPSAYMYDTLMKATGADAATTVVVGDSLLTDIAAAAPLGLYSVLVLTGVSAAPPPDAPIQPGLVIPSVADLIPSLERARPDVIASTR